MLTFQWGNVFRRQNLTFVDVRFWRLKTVAAVKQLKYLQWAYSHNIGMQMKQKDLTKTFTMISNWTKTLVALVYTKVFQRRKG